MHGTVGDRRALEREALRNVIAQWNANRLDIFELSEPNEDLEFHGVMRFYFQDSGQKVATKCIRVASDATVEDVIAILIEKFRPDMRMLSVPSYALYEIHENCPERKMSPDEKPLLVQLNWHVDDREGRFLLKNIDDKTVSTMGLDSNASFRRKLSKREKKQLKKQEKLSRMKSENGGARTKQDGVAEKLYTELPETSFTRSISNPEAVMRRRRQQKLERKLQQFRSKDGGPDTGGTLKIYGEALCRDVPYKTLLLSVRDCASAVVREMLEKYGLNKADPTQWCLVQVTQLAGGGQDSEYVLDDDECPLSILMNSPSSSSIMFHVRRRPADCAPRKRKKKPGIGANTSSARDPRGDMAPLLVELGPDGSAPHPGDTARTIRLNNDVMEVGSANGIALQLYGPHIQPRHCVITNTDGVTSLTPCHADAYTYVNGQRIHQTTILTHGSLVKFGHSNTYRFLDPAQEDRTRHPAAIENTTRSYDRSPRALSPTEPNRDNFETTFDLEGNVETVSTASGAREDNRSLGSSSENRISGLDRYPRGQDPILPAVLEFPEEPQEQFLARVITHLDVTTPTFRLAPAYTLYLCARYRASTHYRPELTPTERAHKLTLLLQHAAMLVRHTVQDRSTESTSQAFWLANASELLNFLKSDRHVSAFSVQAQDTLADSVQSAFRNLVACLTDELNSVMANLMSDTADDHPREIINILSGAMNLLRKCRVNAALTIQLFSQLFHWISARSLSTIINNPQLCTRNFGMKLFNRLRNLQAWAESQGLELAAECHLAKIVQCAHLLQAPKYSAEELASLSSACFKLNSLQLRALLTQYKAEPNEQVASPPLLEQAARAAEGVADELARAEGREVRLHEDPAPALQLLLPDDGFSCDVVQGVPPGLADFLHPLQASGLCRLAAQPTSSGHWTVYMSAPRPPSALGTTQPEVLVIRLHGAGGGVGLSIVAAKGAGQERLGIYIKSVVPGGAADRDGRLAAGDQLLSVDGQSLLGITQEKAAEFLVRTGNVVTLEVAKGGAVYHGLATLLQQPSPTPHRGPRRMSERDLPSRVDSERTIPSSKSVPALHHISPGSEQPRGSHDVFNPGYSRTSSNNSINTNSVAPQNGQNNPNALRSRSTHNLNQQDGGFYQNLSVYRNKMPSPQQLGDRTSALRSSQNSLQSNMTNSQRPVSAYYPPASAGPNAVRSNLHQSIPNLKNPPSIQKIHAEEARSGSYPSVNQYQGNFGQHMTYPGSPSYAAQQQHQGQNYPGSNQSYPGSNQNYPSPNQNYPSPNQNYPSPNQNFPSPNPNYPTGGPNNYPAGSSQNFPAGSNQNFPAGSNQNYPAGSNQNYPVGSNQNYPSNLQQPLHINANGPREEVPGGIRYSNTGLLREDVFRHSQSGRNEEMIRYPSTNNVRIQEAQIQHSQDLSRNNEMRTSKSDDMIRHHAGSNDMMRYASSGNIRAQESNKIDLPQLRGQAKMAEMGEEVRRRQNRPAHQQSFPPFQTQNSAAYYQQQQQQQGGGNFGQGYGGGQMHSPLHAQMAQNAQSLQNLNLNSQSHGAGAQNLSHGHGGLNAHGSQNAHGAQGGQGSLGAQGHSLHYPNQQGQGGYPQPGGYYGNQPGTPTSPTYPKSPPVAPKPMRKIEDPPELPPTSTHPLYGVVQEAATKVPLFAGGKFAKDPWQREEQERLAEARREQARQWQEQQIRDLSALSNRTQQQEEQLRVLQLEREFQRRAMEAAEQDDDDTEKESPTSYVPPSVPSTTVTTTIPTATVSTKQEVPTSILKPGNNQVQAQPPPQEPQAPPPPERGSSYVVMSMRNKEGTKRVSFNDASATPQPPTTLQIEEPVREDPNSFIRQAESMLASPTTPTDGSGGATATPGVIGAQEVYRDPRTRRLAEQAQQQNKQTPVPEKLSFKEKMKMFAMESGESGTPRDKSKISRAQRDIDNLGSPPPPPNPSLVH